MPPTVLAPPADNDKHKFSLEPGGLVGDTCCGVASVVGADVNGDRLLDVAVLHGHYHFSTSDKNLDVAMVYGGRRFNDNGWETYFIDGSPARVERERARYFMAAGDLDSDPAHRIDLVGIDGKALRRAYHTGDKFLSTSELLALDVVPQRLLVGDVTADGLPDLVVEYGADVTALRTRVYMNSGKAMFSGPVGDGEGGFGDFPLLADLDGDGVAEQLGVQGAEVVVRSFTRDLGFTVRHRARFDTDGHGHALTLMAADLDGDGHPDAVVGEAIDVGLGGGLVVVLRGDGNGGLQQGLATPTRTAPTHLGSADFDGDSFRDVAATLDEEPWNIVVLFGAGDGTFDGARTFASDFATALIVDEDAAGDGIPDLLLMESGEGRAPDPVIRRAGRR